MCSKRAGFISIFFGLVLSGSISTSVLADEFDKRFKLLEATIHDLLKRDEEKDRIIEELRVRVLKLNAGQRIPEVAERHQYDHDKHDHKEHAHNDASKGHDEGLHDHHQGPDIFSLEVGNGAILRLRGMGLDTALSAGYSSATDAQLNALQAGGHDPSQNGFTLRTVDLSIVGALDPYFDAETHIALFLDDDGETKLELEEAFLTTKNINAFDIKVGHYHTEFGFFNPLHLHDWDWVDQPVVLSRFFGGDGMRQLGARMGLSLSPRTRFLVGAQNAKGETMRSFIANSEVFEEDPIGGRSANSNQIDDLGELVYAARFAHTSGTSDRGHWMFGLSGAFGPNATGNDAQTRIVGADFSFQTHLKGDGYVRWVTEGMYRDYEAVPDSNNGFAADDLEDWGLYTQLLYGIGPEWAFGLRYEHATGSGESVGSFADRQSDSLRADRTRVSPLAQWQFAPGAKARLQYNYDESDDLTDDDVHSLWFDLSWSIGAGNTANNH